MARYYHVATAALAIGCPARWLDNLLSQFEIPGVVRLTRGVTRQLPIEALLRISVARALVEEIGLTTGRAVSLAGNLCEDADGRIVLPSGLSLQVDLTRVRRLLETRLLDAVQTSELPRRGRPPVLRSRGSPQRPGQKP